MANHIGKESISADFPEVPLAESNRVTACAPLNLEISQPSVSQPAKPWGALATFAWSVLIGFGYVLAQSFAIRWLIRTGTVPIHSAAAQAHSWDGILFAVACVAGAIAATTICIIAVFLRNGISTKEYLGLSWPAPKVVSKWMLSFIAYILVVEAFLNFLSPRFRPYGLAHLHATAGAARPLLWLYFILIGPVMEELCFRGFLLKGLKDSVLRIPGAVILTTIFFTICHGQREICSLMEISAAGFFLALVRLETNSVLLCVFFHSGLNLVLTLWQLNGR